MLQGTSVDISITMTMLCTTKMKCTLYVNMEGVGEFPLVDIQVESELSTKLDYSEIVIDGGPVGEGSFGVVYKVTT